MQGGISNMGPDGVAGPRRRIERIPDLKEQYDDIAIPRPAAKEAVEELRHCLQTMKTRSRLDTFEMAVESSQGWLESLPVEAETVSIYWLGNKGGVRIEWDAFVNLCDDLLYPIIDDVWIVDDGRTWLLEFNREEVFTLWASAAAKAAPGRGTSKLKSRIMYVELKSGQNDRGPAWIGRVRFSKSGRTIYYRGMKLQRIGGGECFDVATGDEYWISGCKKRGGDRHWAGGGPVLIDEDAREEYWTQIRRQPARRNVGVI